MPRSVCQHAVFAQVFIARLVEEAHKRKKAAGRRAKAAIEIQRFVRGMLARRRAEETRESLKPPPVRTQYSLLARVLLVARGRSDRG